MKKEFKETEMELANENNVEEVTTVKKNLWTKVKETAAKNKTALIALAAALALGFAIKHFVKEDETVEIEPISDDEFVIRNLINEEN